jgi:hypothetical protein
VALSRKRGGNALPDPLTRAETNLNGYEFMPILLTRLFGSEFFALATLEERAVGMTLWLQSWYQLPAGSLPNDDRHLAFLAHCAIEKFKTVKDMALHRWVLCSDGRFYHPLIAKEVDKAWTHRLDHEEKRRKDAERKREWRARQRHMDVTRDIDGTSH